MILNIHKSDKLKEEWHFKRKHNATVLPINTIVLYSNWMHYKCSQVKHILPWWMHDTLSILAKSQNHCGIFCAGENI